MLVVFGHVWRGLKAAGLAVPCYEFVDSVIYSFHMPLFFFISGMLVEHSARKPAGAFLADKARTVLYPYVLWSLLDAGVAAAASPWTNRSVSLLEVAQALPYQPYAHFWFLYVLGMSLLAFMLLYKLGVGVRIIAAAALVFWFTSPWIPLGPWGAAYTFRRYFVYFAAGALMSDALRNVLPRAPASLLAAACVVQFALLAAAVGADLSSPPPGPLITAIAGAGGVLCAAALLQRGPAGSLLSFLGRMSLAIYVAHVIAASGVRIVLHKVLHIDSTALHVVAGTAAGIALPLLLDYVARRAGWPFLFTLGRQRAES